MTAVANLPLLHTQGPHIALPTPNRRASGGYITVWAYPKAGPRRACSASANEPARACTTVADYLPSTGPVRSANGIYTFWGLATPLLCDVLIDVYTGVRDATTVKRCSPGWMEHQRRTPCPGLDAHYTPVHIHVVGDTGKASTTTGPVARVPLGDSNKSPCERNGR